MRIGRCEFLDGDAELTGFIDSVVRRGAAVRLADLQRVPDADALYRVRDRHGIDVVAVRTTSLTQSQLIRLLEYRMTQYLLTGFFDPEIVYQRRLTHEPLTEVAVDDVHVVVTSAGSGEVLCYGVLRSPEAAPPRATLRSPDRPLLPLEQAHGRGIFNRLNLLPDLPLTKIREIGRFVKNQTRDSAEELQIRGPVEAGVALFRTAMGPLRSHVEAAVGSFQEGVAKRNLDYFHVPLVVIRGTVPWTDQHCLLTPRYRDRATYPFAVLVSDLDGCNERLSAIEEALSRPGHEGLLALMALKDDHSGVRSTLEPSAGLPLLSVTDVAQETLSGAARRHLRDVGELLRATRPFAGLSAGEAAVLATFTEVVDTPAGETLVHEGDIGDDLFVVCSGEAEVRVHQVAGVVAPMARLKPGDHFGEIALVTGGTRSADVVAVTPMTVLKIRSDVYRRYLAPFVDVELEVTRAAAARLRRTSAAQRVE